MCRIACAVSVTSLQCGYLGNRLDSPLVQMFVRPLEGNPPMLVLPTRASRRTCCSGGSPDGMRLWSQLFRHQDGPRPFYFK